MDCSFPYNGLAIFLLQLVNFHNMDIMWKLQGYSIIGSPESRVFILVALARVNASNWFNIMTRLASFYRE